MRRHNLLIWPKVLPYINDQMSNDAHSVFLEVLNIHNHNSQLLIPEWTIVTSHRKCLVIQIPVCNAMQCDAKNGVFRHQFTHL